ncbi:MAG: hypothetical protein C4576_05085 [Desulfobacteraceae bacterium]|nr:MAG: hypothetical protein C4576_05085 [Desulfobacteraceae bacterium]
MFLLKRKIGLAESGSERSSLVENPKWERCGLNRCKEPPAWDPWSELYQKRFDEIRRAKAEISFKRRAQWDMDGAIATGCRFSTKKEERVG